jgi:hypothetical protein
MRRCVALLAALGLLVAVWAAPAQAAPIEGVWSFNGGKVAIQSEGSGGFSGTVVAPTKFSNCFHPVAEEMWTQMKPQADGSYWGLHQWFYATEDCVINPQPGLTAWRVLQTGSGSLFLRVCFSEPGSDSQPTIAADGSVAGATFGCNDSARISGLPTIKQSEVGKYIHLPTANGCLARSKIVIRLHGPVADPLKKVSVRLKSGNINRRAKLKRKGSTVIAMINLKGLSTDEFKVVVHATTVLGAHISKQRKYHRCASRAKKPHKSQSRQA